MEEIEEILEKTAGKKEPKGPLTVVRLEAHHCRWPIGTPSSPNFHFCGKDKVAGKPYCKSHLSESLDPRGRRKST